MSNTDKTQEAAAGIQLISHMKPWVGIAFSSQFYHFIFGI